MTTTREPLLPCPRCRGNAKIVTRDVEPQGDPWYGSKTEMFVECQACSLVLFDGHWHEGFTSEAAATAFWNTRPAAAQGQGGEAVRALRDWIEAEKSKISGEDGYNYASGQEFGLRQVLIECDKRIAALAPQPAGWKLVPVEPTKEMIAAVHRELGYPSGCGRFVERAYKILLSASPATPSPQGPEVDEATVERG